VAIAWQQAAKARAEFNVIQCIVAHNKR